MNKIRVYLGDYTQDGKKGHADVLPDGALV